MKSEKHGGNIHRVAAEYGILKSEIIDFSSNINPLGPPSELKERIFEYYNDIVLYPDPEYTKGRAALAEWHSVDANNVFLGNGAIELIYDIVRGTAAKNALIIAPTFSEYASALQGTSTRIDYELLSSTNDFLIEAGSMREALSREYDLVVLCNPNNPTGAVCERRMLEKIIEWTAKNNAVLLVDESFIEFVEHESEVTALDLVGEYKQLVILRSLTKMYAVPGLRLGYAVCCDRDLCKSITAAKGPWSVNLFADIAVRLVPGLDAYRKATREYISKERAYLVDILSALPWIRVFPSAVNFLLLQLDQSITSNRLQQVLLKDNILVRDAANFISLDDSYVRIAVKGRNDNVRLIEALEKISFL